MLRSSIPEFVQVRRQVSRDKGHLPVHPTSTSVYIMARSNDHGKPSIDKRDFDANRPLLHDSIVDGDGDERVYRPPGSRSRSRHSRPPTEDGLDGRSDGLLSDVVEEIVERDRMRMQREVVRVSSFVWGVVSWYVSRYHLHSVRMSSQIY